MSLPDPLVQAGAGLPLGWHLASHAAPDPSPAGRQDRHPWREVIALDVRGANRRQTCAAVYWKALP